MIDSKPVQPPYLNLIPLKNFSKKEQEVSRGLIKKELGNQSSKILNSTNA